MYVYVRVNIHIYVHTDDLSKGSFYKRESTQTNVSFTDFCELLHMDVLLASAENMQEAVLVFSRYVCMYMCV